MAQASDVRTVPLTADSAKWLLAGIIVAAVSGASFLIWLDDRITDNVRNYANEYIFPRIVENERDIDEIKAMIESSDMARNRQYGELKSNQADMYKVMKDIRAMGIGK